MEDYLAQFLEAGVLAKSDTRAAERVLMAIPRSFYDHLWNNQQTSFVFLAGAPIDTAFAFIRGMALAETRKLSPFPGSVSLLIPAFVACQARAEEEVAAIADWIVVNHDNPYTPFNFRRTRENWELAREDSPSPVHTLRRVQEMEQEGERAKVARARQQSAIEAIQGLKAGRSPDSPALRERMLEEMEREMLED